MCIAAKFSSNTQLESPRQHRRNSSACLSAQSWKGRTFPLHPCPCPVSAALPLLCWPDLLSQQIQLARVAGSYPSIFCQPGESSKPLGWDDAREGGSTQLQARDWGISFSSSKVFKLSTFSLVWPFSCRCHPQKKKTNKIKDFIFYFQKYSHRGTIFLHKLWTGLLCSPMEGLLTAHSSVPDGFEAREEAEPIQATQVPSLTKFC